MITAIVRFNLPASVSLADAKTRFLGSAPEYEGLAGLVRKYYLKGDGVGGGVYLWESREAAEKVYTPAWRKMIADRYGAEPEILYFDTPVVVDNTTHQVLTDAAE